MFAASAVNGQELSDPLKNRLFVMPTGEIIDKGSFVIATMDMVAIEAAYAPTSYLEISTIMFNPFMLLFDDTRRDFSGSFGGKLQIMQPNGLLHGTSIGVNLLWLPTGRDYHYYENDFVFYSNWYDKLFNIYPPRTSAYSILANVSSSFGNSNVQGHASYGQLYYFREDRGFPIAQRSISNYAQFGLSAGGNLSQTWGLKIMTELFFSSPFDKYATRGLIVGFRIYRPVFAFDVGIPLGFEGVLPRKDDDMPYVGLNIFL